MIINNPYISGSIEVEYGITGSLYGTASYAENAISSSYINTLHQDVEITGSLDVSGSVLVTGSVYIGETSASGVILVAPDGGKWILQVSNLGTASFASA